MPVPALIQVIAIATVCGVVGFFYVYLKVQTEAKYRETKRLERRLSDLRQGNDILRSQIDHYTSREHLLKQSAAGYIQLVPIPEDSLVRLPDFTGTEGLAQLGTPTLNGYQ
jgi:uncharacterized membrane-anchored protein YhcB (DUF1043 family)